MPLPTALRALRHRNFRLFATGQMISLVGTWMQMVAQSWLVYRLTGSATLLGLVAFASQVPILLLGPVGGAVADRCRRHTIILTTQASSMVLAFVLAVLTLTNHVQVWHLFVLASLLGSLNSFDIPARQSFFVEMVGREDLMNAIALNSSMFTGARIVGPALAGGLVAVIGEGWCFFANGASYLAVLAGLLMMDIPREPRPRSTTSPAQEIREGLAYVYQTAPIRDLMLLLGLVSFSSMPYGVLMPIVADQILQSGAQGLGILMGASGLGALLGALSLAAKTDARGLGRWTAWSAVGFGVALMVFSFSKVLWLSVALLIPVGFASMVQMASSNTLVQSMVPDALRGRVMSVHATMFLGMAPFGSLAAGSLASSLGAPTTIAAGGVVCIIGGCLFWLRLPHLREEARRLVAAQGGEAHVPSVHPG